MKVILFLRVMVPYGLVVRISGFHPDNWGSIPGMGTRSYGRITHHDVEFPLSKALHVF